MKIKRIIIGIVIVLVCGYVTFAFLPIPGIRDLRDLYIETAMSTATHKYLATFFFPKSIIDEVLDKKNSVIHDFGSLETTAEKGEDRSIKISYYDDLNVGDKDLFDNEVYAKDNGIVILKLSNLNYIGYLAIIDDPKRVYVSHQDHVGKGFEKIGDYVKKEEAILGINASGFDEKKKPAGFSRSKDVTVGEYKEKNMSFGFTHDDDFVVGHFSNWDDYDIRDGAQFAPALIINGDPVVFGSNGWGFHPRTAIGQMANKQVVMMTVDGRQPGYSLGITVGDMANILLKYGVVNACLCDGGSSTVMYYDDHVVNKPSETNPKTGADLPNAFVVKKDIARLETDRKKYIVSENNKIGDIVECGYDKKKKCKYQFEIVDIKDNRALIVMKTRLNDLPVEDFEFTEGVYEDTEIYKLVNNDFFSKAFSDEEKKVILKTGIENTDLRDREVKFAEGFRKGMLMADAFLLSIEEISKYKLPEEYSAYIHPAIWVLRGNGEYNVE